MLKIPQVGFNSMLKKGAQSFSGLEEAVLRNINACIELTELTRTSLGPFGMNKIIINQIEKLFVTKDASTIVKELSVEHPAARIIVLASQQQDREIGDATNFVIIFAGELLKQALSLFQLGLHPNDVITGFNDACEKALTSLGDLECYRLKNFKDVDEVAKCLKTSIGSKQYGYEDFLARLVARACVDVCPASHQRFNVDNIRVTKIPGGSILDSSIVNGIVLQRAVEGTITHVEDAVVAVYSCPVDISRTETKGTVLIRTGKELENFSNNEEAALEQIIREISLSGINVVVTGSQIGDMALHFCEKYCIMVVRVQSKFDLRRLSNAIGATPLARLGAPMAEEVGRCDSIKLTEIGDENVVLFSQNKSTVVSTIILRGATSNILDDTERAIDSAVNTYKQLSRDARMIPGAAASELELARMVNQYGTSILGLSQYAVKSFAKAFEVIPTTLAHNAGKNSSELLSKMHAVHSSGSVWDGLDVNDDGVSLCNAKDVGILDLLIAKHYAIRLATEAATTILSIDQIIMARKSGGPKPRDNPNWDED
jgi:T-complex protein 1 subunit theta